MSKRRLLVLGILSFCLVLAVASPAFAATRSTRISGLPSSVAIALYRGTGTLTYARSGHRYVISRALIKIYRYTGGHWVYHSHTHTTTKGKFSVSEPAGYTYKFVYAGSRGRYYSCSRQMKVTSVTTGIAVDSETLVLSDEATSGIVSGQLWMTSGSAHVPLAGVQVSISRVGVSGTTAAVTNASGVWSLNLFTGNYRVSYAGDKAHRSCSSTFTLAVDTFLDVTSTQEYYTPAPGAMTAPVSGTVRFDLGIDDGEGDTWGPIPGAPLTVCDHYGGSIIMTITSDAAGGWTADLPLGSYDIKYAGATMLLVDGVYYNMDSMPRSLHVTAYPTTWAYSEMSNEDAYLVGSPATGNIAFYDSDDGEIPFSEPVELNVLQWNDSASDFVAVDTVTTDAAGNWSASFPPGEYVLEYEGDSDYVSGGTHYDVAGSACFFYVVSELPPPE